jgi:hypothetical protein
VQQLKMLKRKCYSASVKRWTVGGMYAELQMGSLWSDSRLTTFPLVYNNTISIGE